MTSQLLTQFEQHPQEQALIGEMLLAYAELEFAVLDILNAVLGDAQTALRTLYQLRSETHRLTVMEAIATPWFEKIGMGGQLREGITATNHCKNMRNQYAHCTFITDRGVLRFANLEIPAKSKGGKCEVIASPITLSLLKAQRAYFDYADAQLLWLNQEYRSKNDLKPLSAHKAAKPRRVSPPKLNSRGQERSPR